MNLFERYLTVWVRLSIIVGVLIEVPVMLLLVIANAKQGWYGRGTADRLEKFT